jgi:hypothetical protein
MRYAPQQRAKQRTNFNRQKVRAYQLTHPDLSQKEVGKHFGKTGAWVSWILKQ